MASDSDEEDFHFFGTPIEEEEETRAGQHRKEVKDAASTRALPLHQQEVTDEQGRRRFHGAFTGGYSAGYFNTVGSKEGWQPGAFRSTRDSRARVQQNVEQFLDEDELEELRRTNLQTTQQYDTFGSTAAELARRAAAEAAAERPSAIPGLLPEEMVAPVADSVGIQLLQKMGWRQGKGIGVGDGASGAAEEDEGDGDAAACASRRRRRWGQHVSVAAENTALYLLAPKTDVHGLGFDPFKGAEDFRRIKEAAREAARPRPSAAELGKKRRRGVAFGTGVLDEDDSYGLMDDYVTHDDVDGYEVEDVPDDTGLPRSKVPVVQKSGLGDRLARKGYTFEIMDEEEDDAPAALGWHGGERQRQYALPGREAPLLLQSREQQVNNSIIPGFVRATATVTITFFPPPRVPPGYVPVHHPSRDAEAAMPAASLKFAPPQAHPPASAELRQAIDSLAFFVARNGVIFENMARQRQQKEGRWAFLSGGEGAAYYRWKVHSLRSILQQPQQQKRQQRPIGQRSAPLSADERGAMLGEQPLASSAGAAAAAGWAAGAAGSGAAAVQAAGQAQDQALRRQLLQIAEGDRQRLQQLLSRSFVAAESKEMLQPDAAAAAVAGLRPGAPAPAPRPAAGTAGAAGAAKVVTEADLARPVDLAAGAAPAGGGLQVKAAGGQQQGQARLPVRRSEEWRPVPLLCKRFNVPDPYHGRPEELQMSRFRTDHLALPDTASAVAASLNAVPAGAQDFLLPPSVAAALAEAEAKLAQVQQAQQAAAALPTGRQPAPQAPPPDASGAADAFLSSLSDMLGGAPGSDGGGNLAAEPAPPLPTEPPPEDEAEREAERPVDLFKAIFEDSDDDDEEEEEEEEEQPSAQPRGEAQPPGPAAANGQQQLAGSHTQQQAAHPGPLYQRQAQPQQQRDPQAQAQAAFGFAKLRDAPVGPLSGAAAAPAAAAAPVIDEEVKRRVQDALRALKKDKKKDKKEKRSSRKKEKKTKQKSVSKDKGKDKKRRHREGDHKKRRSGSGRSSDSGSSSSGSDSD